MFRTALPSVARRTASSNVAFGYLLQIIISASEKVTVAQRMT
jgi:hypothetical protein